MTRFTGKINTSEQATGADGLKRALGLLVHDEIVIEATASWL